MSEFFSSQDLNGKSIISVSNGQIVGEVDDLMVDPDALRVAAIVTSKGSLFKREVEAIPSEEVEVWGYDVVLVRQPDVIAKEEEQPLVEEWLTVSDQINGKEVVDTDGTRVGQLEDVVFDTKGQLISYKLSQAFVQDPKIQSLLIPARATQSLGPDVLIIDRSILD